MSMELGEKLRLARLEAGLSQRELCGEEITRNMLSRIEHGAAGPSMGTLRYLAARLGKPVSYFLDEDAVVSPNQGVMEAARRLYDTGDWAEAAETLKNYRGPDEIFDREQGLLLALVRLSWAEALMETGRTLYAREILEATQTAGLYCGGCLESRRLLLLSRIQGVALPSIDEALLARADLALRAGDGSRAGKLLDAAEDVGSSRWHLLRGQAYALEKAYAPAAEHLQKVEAVYPDEAIPLLEECFRELGDYKQAYAYAQAGRQCRQPIRHGDV